MYGLFGDGPGLPPVSLLGNGAMQLRGPTRAPQLPQPPPQPSWREKLLRGLFPTPGGLEGVMAPEDLADARRQGLLGLGRGLLEMSGPVQGGPAPSLGQALAHGLQTGQEATGGAVQNGLLVDDRRMALQRQQARARIAAMFPEQPGETRDQQINRIRQMFSAYVRIGDTEMAGKLGEVLKSVDNQSSKGNNWEDFGGYKALMSPEGRELSEQRHFQRENQLADDFRSATKMHSDVSNFIGVIEASGPSALSGDPTAQQSIMFGIMKLNDPGSSVKEGEYATAANAQGVSEKMRNEYNKLLQGTTLSPTAVQRYLDQSSRLKGVWSHKFKLIRGQFERRAQTWKIDPKNIITDLFGEAQAPSGGAARANRLLSP